ECTPPGDTKPIKWQVPPVRRKLSTRLLSAGALSMSPLAIAASMRGKSCITRRPAPMLRCPTSELPICPSGRPTSLPEVRTKACGQVAHRWPKLGVRAWRIALSATSLRQPQPSSTTSMTGRRFCISTRPRRRTSAGEIAAAGNDRSSDVCVRSQGHRQPARSLACASTWGRRACFSCHTEGFFARCREQRCRQRSIRPRDRIYLRRIAVSFGRGAELDRSKTRRRIGDARCAWRSCASGGGGRSPAPVHRHGLRQLYRARALAGAHRLCCRVEQGWRARSLYLLVSGSNFIADTRRNIYEGPHQRRGYSRINFGGTPEQIRKRVEYVNALYRSGHEIASHAVGHFNGASWSVRDWEKEFRAFGQILKNVGPNNGLLGSKFAFPVTDLIGFRAPYLAKGAALYSALKTRDFRYDTSGVGQA